MSNPVDDIPGRKKPRRAQPEQPDNPLIGGEKEDGEKPDTGLTEQAQRQKSQSDDALSNVRNDT